jgi:hypothetical protein
MPRSKLEGSAEEHNLPCSAFEANSVNNDVTSDTTFSSSSSTATRPAAMGLPRGARLMTLDPAAGSVPSHAAKHGVRGMLGLFESRNEGGPPISKSREEHPTVMPTDTPTAAAAAASQRVAHDNQHVQTHASSLASSLVTGNSTGAPATHGRSALLGIEVEGVGAHGESEADEQKSAGDGARGGWRRGGKLAAHVALACSPSRPSARGVSVECLKRLRDVIVSVDGGVSMTTEQACRHIVKPACVSAGGELNARPLQLFADRCVCAFNGVTACVSVCDHLFLTTLPALRAFCVLLQC